MGSIFIFWGYQATLEVFVENASCKKKERVEKLRSLKRRL